MSSNKSINEDDVQKFAQEQFEYHTQKAKYWELVVKAVSKTGKNNGSTIATIALPAEKAINTALLKSLNDIFLKYNYDLKTAKEWYGILKNEGIIKVAFASFYSNLKDFVEAKEVAHIEVPKVKNAIKFWYGSINCLDDNGDLKKEYKLKLEENMKIKQGAIISLPV